LTRPVDRQLVVGGILVAVYLAAAVLTLPGPLGLRPLFDGTGGTVAPYRWVKPPRELAAANISPASKSVEVKLNPTGSAAADASTDDGQALVSLPDNAFAAHPPDTGATLAVDPVNPDTLVKPGGTLQVDGNAYHVSITYKPSGTAVTAMARPGSVLLRYPTTADMLLYSPDGQAWQPLKAVQSPGNQTVLAQITGPGYFEAALNLTGPQAKAKKKGASPVLVGIEIAGALVVVGIVIVLFRRPGQGRKPVKKAGPAAAAKKPKKPKKRRR
jgi:hypothetical protein